MSKRLGCGKLFDNGLVLGFVLACAAITANAGQHSTRSAAGLDSQSIVGSWKVVDDQTGDIFFGTYNGGPSRGTVNFTAPDNSISLTHGIWKRIGARTFADTDSAFIFDENGIAILIITFRAEVEVSRDGNSAFFDFAFEVTDFDGTVVDAGASTGTGTRIEIRPLR